MQIYKEINTQYPDIKDMYITRGAHVAADSLKREGVVLFLQTQNNLSEENLKNLTDWLKVRLNDQSAIVINSAAPIPVTEMVQKDSTDIK